jgi:alginate O-acetyltransferase complex protein AlgJ
MRFLVCLTLASTALAAGDPAADFRDRCARQAAAGEAMMVPGDEGWLFLRGELRHIGVGPFWGEAAAKVSRASSPEKADPLPAIVDFHEQLEKLGIDLLVVPVPCKALVYPERRAASMPCTRSSTDCWPTRA